MSYDPSRQGAKKSVTGSKHHAHEETNPHRTKCGFFGTKRECHCAPLLSEKGSTNQVSGSQPGWCFPRTPHQGTLGNTWSHIWLSWLWAVRCYWHSRGQRSGMLFTSHSVQQKPSTKKRNPFSMSVVQRSRNHEIDNILRIRGHFFPQNQKLNRQTKSSKVLANQVQQHVKWIIHHDQVGIYCRMKGQFNSQKLSNVI